MMITVWRVEFTNAVTGKVESSIYFGNEAHATRYAHNKCKANDHVTARLIKVEALIVEEKMINFHIGRSKLAL